MGVPLLLFDSNYLYVAFIIICLDKACKGALDKYNIIPNVLKKKKKNGILYHQKCWHG